MPTPAFIHTSHVLIPLFTELSKRHLPDVETAHMVDHFADPEYDSDGGLAESAREAGADVVVVTCSSGPGGTSLPRLAECFRDSDLR